MDLLQYPNPEIIAGDPDPQDPLVPVPLVIGTDPDPDPSFFS